MRDPKAELKRVAAKRLHRCQTFKRPVNKGLRNLVKIIDASDFERNAKLEALERAKLAGRSLENRALNGRDEPGSDGEASSGEDTGELVSSGADGT